MEEAAARKARLRALKEAAELSARAEEELENPSRDNGDGVEAGAAE
jgi:hypothetical protein